MRLKDKIALITGAGSGIGLATAQSFAREGARVILCDISEENLQKVQQSWPGPHAWPCRWM